MTAGRLLHLLSLLQTGREWPGSELAERLAVSPRTVRRDVDRLRELGYPVQASLGASGGYALSAGAALPPLLLEDDEAVAITVGLRLTAGQPVAGLDEASVRALAKLVQVLPARLRGRVSALTAATSTLPSASEAVADPEALTLLAAAIQRGSPVRFNYQGKARHAEPHHLVATGRRWYLVAFDNDRNDWRTSSSASRPPPAAARHG